MNTFYWGYEAQQNRINRGYRACKNTVLIEVTKPVKNRINKELLAAPLLLRGRKMRWINVNEKYLDYLRNVESRIPRTD